MSADLENGFADDPEGVAATIALAVDAGLAGCSIEDYSGGELYATDLAADRVAAAAEAAHGGDVHLVLTARAENHIRGNPTSPTRSRACRRSRKPAPTCCTRPGSPTSTTSAGSSPRSTGR